MSATGMFAELDPIFHPKSIALIGASNKAGKIGRLLTGRFIEMEFKDLYPVNPRESEVMGVRAYGNIGDIPGPVDMAIVLTPTAAAKAAVEGCVSKGVRTIVITTSGFGETGDKGKGLEQEMVRLARRTGSRIIGPNCIGIHCPSSRLPFPTGGGRITGSVGLVSQSGFFADFLTHIVNGNGIGFSKAVSCGNECDLSVTDFLEYLGEDPDTRTIVAYIEGIKDGRRFYALAKEISKRKPIILWKGGNTEAGARVAASHTGALAGSRKVWDGALRQAGIVSVGSFEEMLDCLYAFHLQPVPAGPRVGIVSGPGGMAVSSTDLCVELGLEVPQFSAFTLERLRETLALAGTTAGNPVDLGFISLVAPGVHKDSVRIVAREDIDMLLLITAVGGERLRDDIIEAMGPLRASKPIAVATMSGTMRAVSEDFPVFLAGGIPVYTDPARACRILARLWEYAQFRTTALSGKETSGQGAKHPPLTFDEVQAAQGEGRTILTEHASKQVLRAGGIPVTEEKEVHNFEDFKRALTDIGFPCVIKAGGPGMAHKTELGLVYLDIRTLAQGTEAYREIMEASGAGQRSVLVQRMIKGSRELIIGLINDAHFGPCVMFGLGGVFAEVLQDISYRVAPLKKAEAVDMMRGIAAGKVLGPFRGMPAADMERLADILVRLGDIGVEHPEIKEVDINPVMLDGDAPIAADALIVLRGPRTAS